MKKSVVDIIDDGIMKVEFTACFIMLVTMIMSVFMNAVFRIFGSAIDWSTDMAQLMFVWVSVLGADMALKKSRHVGVDLLTRKLPNKVNTLLMILIYVAMVIFLVTVAYYGVNLAIQNSKRMFNTLPISYSWATMAVPVGFSLMTFTVLRHISFLVFGKKDYYEDKLEDRVNVEAL